MRVWIGLDPARPLFEWMPTFVRLDPTDAQFVDVVHTDGCAGGISSNHRLHAWGVQGDTSFLLLCI